LQAFSRTNRVLRGKEIGMIVTFRKPWTMRKNVENAFKLFSQEDRDWEQLVPREYKAVRKQFKDAHKAFAEAKNELNNDSNDLMKMIAAINTFQAMQTLGEAMKSYDEYNEELENDPAELSAINEAIAENTGYIENIKAEVKEILPEKPPKEAFEIEFSPDQRATLEEKIDSYYIRLLLGDFNNESNRQKFYDTIKSRPPIVKAAYDEALSEAVGKVAEDEVTYCVDNHFRRTIDEMIKEASLVLKVPEKVLQDSFNEYNSDKKELPYINIITTKSTLNKDDFHLSFPDEMFRRRRIVIEEYWGKKLAMLLPLKEELVNFVGHNSPIATKGHDTQ
jgi:type I restriction enzyme R subunit